VVKRLSVLAVLVTAAAVASMASAPRADALLGLFCGNRTVEKPFAQWSDSNSYVLVSAAESSAGWSLRGASVVSGNEPWYVHSRSESRSIGISQGGRAESPATCITLFDPTARYFVNGSAGGRLQVDAMANLPLGISLPLGSTVISGNGSWSVSDVQRFLCNLTSPLTWSISFRFTALSGNWQVDDVYLDPMMQR
jgi:hypothetical protein